MQASVSRFRTQLADEFAVVSTLSPLPPELKQVVLQYADHPVPCGLVRELVRNFHALMGLGAPF